MLALYIVSIIIGNIVMGSVTAAIVDEHDNCMWNEFEIFVIGLLWWVVLPIVSGIFLINRTKELARSLPIDSTKGYLYGLCANTISIFKFPYKATKKILNAPPRVKLSKLPKATASIKGK